MTRFGMLIDLKKCIGCMACTIACKANNGTRPGIFWNIVKDQLSGIYPMIKRTFLPVLCMHCEEPSCVDVCPTGASYKREDGIVLIDQDVCVACGACLEACPYGVRFLNEGASGYFGKKLTPYEKFHSKEHKEGVVEKCTLCLDRVVRGKEPVCVATCIGKARYFGDLNDPDSEVSKLIRSRHGTQLMKDLGNNPSVYYVI